MKYKDLENEWSLRWIQFILDTPDKDWDWESISRNPNITWDIIRDNQDKPWNWSALSKNSMSKSKKEWINQRRLRHIKALQIQRHWRNCSCNPEYKLAQRMLSTLYES